MDSCAISSGSEESVEQESNGSYSNKIDQTDVHNVLDGELDYDENDGMCGGHGHTTYRSESSNVQYYRENSKNSTNSKQSGTCAESVVSEGVEDGEIIDLEEGELKSDDDSDIPSVHSDGQQLAKKTSERIVHRSPIRSETGVGFCKFFLRGTCTWGSECKYAHTSENLSKSHQLANSSYSRERKIIQGNDRERPLRDIPDSRVVPQDLNQRSSCVSRPPNESEWEKGLRQARELMMKASKKRGEELGSDNQRRHLRSPEGEYDPYSRDSVDRSDKSSHDNSPVRIHSSRSINLNHTGRYIGGTVGRALEEERKARRFFDDLRRRGSNRVDLGPQVLYPNGRPAPRRDRTSRRDYDTAKHVSEQDSSSPKSIKTYSVSPLRPSSPVRQKADTYLRNKFEHDVSSMKRRTALGDFSESAGINIHDPWKRSRKRSPSTNASATTLASQSQRMSRRETRRSSPERHSGRDSQSSVSRKLSSTDSSPSSLPSPQHEAQWQSSRPLYMSAVPLTNVFDDDGSMRTSDLSTFRIPKRKMRSSPNQRDSPKKHSEVDVDDIRRRDKFYWRKVTDLDELRQCDVSDEDSSVASSTSSSSDTAEPAAYRRKNKEGLNDSLPTEGIPLSPEATVEDVSSEEDDYAAADSSPNHSLKNSVSPRNNFGQVTEEFTLEESCKREKDRDCGEGSGQEPYGNVTVRRAMLMRKLRCVEEAIARKRQRPLAL